MLPKSGVEIEIRPLGGVVFPFLGVGPATMARIAENYDRRRISRGSLFSDDQVKFSDDHNFQVKFSDDQNFPTVMIFHQKMGLDFVTINGS